MATQSTGAGPPFCMWRSPPLTLSSINSQLKPWSHRPCHLEVAKSCPVVPLNPSSHSTRPLNEGAWTPPPNEWIKANCDASWISCSQIAGIASVFRNESGSIVGGSTRRGCFSSVSIAEAEAVRSCLIYAKSKDYC
ncbi:hypothetical protein V6N13_103646 [Hibiscus sabdariffa]|uniref:Uncharacterized protein n=2 Tax=Hibiscus sabdariffa TaxID=183260 RepID=A0ABR2AGW2_9ROSI